jgi:hypothetical protein
MIEQRWLRPVDCAAYIGTPAGSLRALVKDGRLPRPSYHLGVKSPRYDREAIDAMITGRQHTNNIDAAIERMRLHGIGGKRKGNGARRQAHAG